MFKGGHAEGGGFETNGGSVNAYGLTFTNNSANGNLTGPVGNRYAAGAYGYGGAIYVNATATVILYDCTGTLDGKVPLGYYPGSDQGVWDNGTYTNHGPGVVD